MYTLPFFQLCWVTEVPSLAVLGKVSDIVRSKGRMEKARKNLKRSTPASCVFYLISGLGYSMWWEQGYRGSRDQSGKPGGVLSQGSRNGFVNYSAIRLMHVSLLCFI